jgi:hypothetical protein
MRSAVFVSMAGEELKQLGHQAYGLKKDDISVIETHLAQ